VALDLLAPHLPPAQAADQMAREQERCPCSVAALGNIEITVTVDRAALLDAADAAP